ncbi:hypothetical protein PMI22_03367 [Pseudomonas sp. GM21]|jgi:hypothetical protein|nr:hypothetical protein PMI22_03367 [Pseudomonas sp. GM21]MDR7284391.1 hypothetical protein [Pseudomonas corrugata]
MANTKCVHAQAQTVGASLLAMTPYQPPSISPDTPNTHIAKRSAMSTFSFFTNQLSNLLSNTPKRDLIPAFQISGTGKRYFRGQKSPAIHPHNP